MVGVGWFAFAQGRGLACLGTAVPVGAGHEVVTPRMREE
jgi:hypothetical protein